MPFFPRVITWRHRVVILTLGIAAWWPSLRTGFFWDDRFLIVTNASLQNWREAPRDFSQPIFADPSNTFYRPLLPLSLRIDYTLWGVRPFGYHLTNLALHLGNALLSIELALLLGAAPLAAFLTGALFVVHPAIVQNLLMVVGRDELLSCFLGFSSVLCLARRGAGGAIAGLFFFVGALLAKESGISTLAFFALTAWRLLERPDYLKRLGMLISVSLIYVLLHHRIIPGVLPEWDGVLFRDFLIKGFPQIVWHYAVLLIWPWMLYTDRMIAPAGAAWMGYAAALVAVIAGLLGTRQRLGLICAAWFIAGLAPKLMKTLTSSMILDHWLYPSLIGVLVPLSIGLVKGWKHRRTQIRWAAGACTAAILIFWTVLCHANLLHRGTEEAFYAWSVRFRTSSTMCLNYAALLHSRGRAEEAQAVVDDCRQRGILR